MTTQWLNKLVYLLLICFLFACSSENDKGKSSFNKSIKLRQYMVQGEALYVANCANCHQKDGSGLRKLIPPLTSKAYIEKNKDLLACILKFGMTGKIQINGIMFDGKMPANAKLTNLQIAEILTYVGNSWGNKLGAINTKDVTKSISSCSTTIP